MRGISLCTALVLSGCAAPASYRVDPRHLEAATSPDTSIPAIAPDGRETFIEVGYVENAPFTSRDGLVEVQVQNQRSSLLQIGWGLLATGALVAGAGAVSWTYVTTRDDGSLADLVPAMMLLSTGGTGILAGGGFVLGGLLAGGPETSGPSPGFPASVQLP